MSGVYATMLRCSSMRQDLTDSTDALPAPPWLAISACIGMAVAVGLAGVVGMQLVPLSSQNEQERAYTEWLLKLRAIQTTCGRVPESNPGCWNQHPLPPDPTGNWRP
jgi:hypothetical protein